MTHLDICFIRKQNRVSQSQELTASSSVSLSELKLLLESTVFLEETNEPYIMETFVFLTGTNFKVGVCCKQIRSLNITLYIANNA